MRGIYFHSTPEYSKLTNIIAFLWKERTHPNLISHAREIENVSEDCKLAAFYGFFRGFGTRFCVHQLRHFFACAPWFLIRYCTKLCTELCSSAAISVPNKSFELCSSAAIVPLSFKFLPNNLLEFEIYPLNSPLK